MEVIIVCLVAGLGVGAATNNGWWGLAAAAYTYAVYRKA